MQVISADICRLITGIIKFVDDQDKTAGSYTAENMINNTKIKGADN